VLPPAPPAPPVPVPAVPLAGGLPPVPVTVPVEPIAEAVPGLPLLPSSLRCRTTSFAKARRGRRSGTPVVTRPDTRCWQPIIVVSGNAHAIYWRIVRARPRKFASANSAVAQPRSAYWRTMQGRFAVRSASVDCALTAMFQRIARR
jgi:hypothetical protein